jgi:hypothetical protein
VTSDHKIEHKTLGLGFVYLLGCVVLPSSMQYTTVAIRR